MRALSRINNINCIIFDNFLRKNILFLCEFKKKSKYSVKTNQRKIVATLFNCHIHDLVIIIQKRKKLLH